MDFEKFSKEIVVRINKELDRLLKDWSNKVSQIDPQLNPLVNQFIKSCNGGKSLRGMLVALGYELSSKLSNKEIYKIAAAFEICHSAILAHDDIIDQSILRRGQPSLYKALGGNHYGLSQALSLGDGGFFLALKIISETNFSDQTKIAALRWFTKLMLDTAMGEMLDVDKGDVTTIMKLKTARYTISGPLVLGATLAGASGKLIKILEEFGEALGIAFQIQDDILGIFGSEKVLGKSTSSDIEEGKNTLLYNYALQKVNKIQRKALDKYYGQGKLRNEELEEIKHIFEETGVLNYAQKMAQEYKSKALKILPNITKDKNMSKLLEQMAEYLVERSK